MNNYYFTYGVEGHPFRGGWTIVTAPDMDSAVEIFKIFHPCKHGNIVNCAGIYTEKYFIKTEMSRIGNRGAGTVEEISLTRTILDESRRNA